MAIGVSEPVAEVASTSNASSYSFGAFTPTGDSFLVVMVFATGTVAAGSMTGGGLEWVKLATGGYNTNDTYYVFAAQCSSSPGSVTITFDCTGDNATGCVMMCFQFTGHNQFNPIKQVSHGNTTGANPAVTGILAMDTNNGYCAAFGMPRNPPTSAAPASWTEVADAGYNTPASGASGAYRAGGETGTSVTFTSASAAYGIAFVEVNEAAVGAQPVSPIGATGMFGV